MPELGDLGNDSLLPVQRNNKEIFRARDFVKVEKNLSSLGFFTPSKSRGKTEVREKTIRFRREVDGKMVEAEATILPSAKYGLPITADQDKYLGFQKIVNDIRQREGKVTNPIGFTSTELLNILGVKDAGNNYHEVYEWLQRMTLTGISSKGVVYFAKKKTWATDTFHIFDRVVTYGSQLSENSTADRNYVWLSEWQLENINNNYVLPIDLEVYRQLRNNIAKALVPLLQVWLYASRTEGRFEKRYEDLCAILDITRQKHLSQIKRQLEPSLNELKFYGYLAAWKIELTIDGRDYKIVADHGEKFFRDQNVRAAISAPSKEVSESRHETSPDLMKALTSRGLNEGQARRLLQSLPSGRPILEQLEYGDWLIHRAKGGIQNPPGFYTYLLRENVHPPVSFQRPGKPQEEASEPEDQEYYEKLRLEANYREYCGTRVAAYLSALADKEEYALMINAKKDDLRSTFPRLPLQTISELAEAAVGTDIEKRLPLPTFEDFCKENFQIDLFLNQ